MSILLVRIDLNECRCIENFFLLYEFVLALVLETFNVIFAYIFFDYFDSTESEAMLSSII